MLTITKSVPKGDLLGKGSKMLWNVEFKEKDKTVNVSVDSDKWYIGTAPDDKQDRDLRKLLGLPVTKALVYYKNPRDESSKMNVLEFRVVKIYEISDFWAIIEIVTDTGRNVKIYSAFLAHMQKPAFVKEFKEMETQSEE